MEKFGLLVDLGIIRVSANPVFMDRFAGGNFPNPSWVFKPGQRIWVRAHRQVVSGTTTSEEWIAFLVSLGSHLTGAQGVRLVYNRKQNQLPRGYWYGSFDKKERLWEDPERNHRVPGMCLGGGGVSQFEICFYEKAWFANFSFFSFCDEPVTAGE